MTDLESEHVDIVQVRDIAETRRFYEEVLRCSKGPGDEQWLDFNLYGHQVVCRLAAGNFAVPAHLPPCASVGACLR